MAKRLYESLVLFTLSTCGYGGREYRREVCQLLWQVFDTTKREPIGEVEQVYVCPDNVSEIVCPTGLRKDNIEQGMPLTKALERFQSVLTDQVNCCVTTNGSIPLRQIIFPEMSEKLQSIPPSLYQYFDLQKEVTKRSNNEFQPHSLSEVCEYLGVDCPSGDLSSYDEIKAMDKVVQNMLVQGHIFESPEMIQQHYQHCNQVNAADVFEGCVIKLRGLPYSADHKDVASFLSGLNIIPGGLVFSINAMGRRTGEAIVVLENKDQAQLALQRDKHYLNQRYIEIYEATPEDLLDFTDNPSSVNVDTAFVVRMQGLPYRASEMDIMHFFEPNAPVKNGADGIMIVRYPDGKASGDGFSIFSTEKDMEEALKKHRQSMMGRYIELFHSSLKEFLIVLNKSGTPEQLDRFSFLNPDTSSASSIAAAKRGSERNCVKLRGLPWEASPEDVIDFFGDLSRYIEQHGIHMVLNAQNRPTGDCYVQMMTVDSASKASSQLHKRNIGRRYIEVFQCSGNEVTFALMESAGGGRGGGHNPYQSGGGGKRKKFSGVTIKARGLPYNTTEYDLVEFFSDFNIEENDVEIVYNESGRSMGVAYIGFQSANDARQAVRDLNHKYIGHRYVELSLTS